MNAEVYDAIHIAPGMPDGARLFRLSRRKALRPPPRLLLWEWADKYRRLSGVASAEEGRFRTKRTPYLREIMEHLSPSHPAQWVVFRKAAQVGATETGNNWVGYFVDQLGGAMLCVQPTVEMAKRWSKQRLAPLLRDTPRIAAKVREARTRDSGNTLMSKEFPGGIILTTGANSAVGLRSMPAQYLNFDEVDGYPDSVDDEGHPIDIAWFRAATFGAFRKVFEVSTPKVRHGSRIDQDMARSDAAEHYVPCLACGTFQKLEPDRLVYPEDDPLSCEGMACIGCGSIMLEGHKTRMLEAGRWYRLGEDGKTWVDRPSRGLVVGFSLSQLYSPLGLGLSWGEIAQRKEGAKTDDNAARVYANLVLGESYEEKSDAPAWELLYERRLDYPIGRVPAGAYAIVAAADVQRDRIEVAWFAFGPEVECWVIDHAVLEGDTATDEVWRALTKAAHRKFAHTEGGAVLPADLFLIDMQYETEAVKLWVRRQRNPRRVRAVQGSESWGAPAIIGRSQTDLTNVGDKKKKRRGFSFWRISTASLKLEVYRRLRRDPVADALPPFGGPWIHHPMFAQEWFEQLTAERIVRLAAPGSRHRSRLAFKKIRPRNEALDLTVYGLAGSYMLKLEQLLPEQWAKYRVRWDANKQAIDEQTEDNQPAARVKKRRTVPRSAGNWVGRY
jgi:phage terminase large subunit GpA-like protein